MPSPSTSRSRYSRCPTLPGAPAAQVPPQVPLIPVMLPIEYLGISVNTSEMVIQGDIGD